MDFWHAFLFVVGVVAGLITGAVMRSRRQQPQVPAPPTIAGQPTGGLVAIDFGKRYDLITRPRSGGDLVVFRQCKILGLTGEDVHHVGIWSSAGLLYGWMHRWVALELKDKRVAYLPTDSVLYVEQSPEETASDEPATPPPPTRDVESGSS